MSSSVSRCERSAMMAAAASKRSRSTIASNASWARTQSSGRLRTRCFLQLEGDPVPDVVADVLLVDQHLVDGAASPGPAQIGENTAVVQRSRRSRAPTASPRRRIGRSSRPSPPPLLGPAPARPGRSGCSCARRGRARPSMTPAWSIEQAPEAVAGGSALAVPVLDQAALAGEDLGRQLAAVLAGHRPLDALDDRRDRAAVVLELLGAVVDLDAGAAAEVLVVGALVGVLEPAPAADVVDEDRAEIGARRSRRRRSAAGARRGPRAAARSCPHRHRCGRSRSRADRRTAGWRRPGSRSSTAGARSTSARIAPPGQGLCLSGCVGDRRGRLHPSTAPIPQRQGKVPAPMRATERAPAALASQLTLLATTL